MPTFTRSKLNRRLNLRVGDRQFSDIKRAVNIGAGDDVADVIRRALDLWFAVDPDLRKRARSTAADLAGWVLRPGCVAQTDTQGPPPPFPGDTARDGVTEHIPQPGGARVPVRPQPAREIQVDREEFLRP